MKDSQLSAIIAAVGSYMEMERQQQPVARNGRSCASRRRQLQDLAWRQHTPIRFRRDRLSRSTLHNC